MWHVDCMFKMGCRFEMTRATTEGTCAEICSHNLNMLRETIFDVTSFYFLTMPQGLVAILTFNPFSLSQTSPDMWQISTYIIILTQLLYCHRELSQAVISFSLLCVTGEDRSTWCKVQIMTWFNCPRFMWILLPSHFSTSPSSTFPVNQASTYK